MRPILAYTAAILLLAPGAGAQERARISLADAITAAEKVAGSGRSVDAELEQSDGRPVYHVTILSSDGAATLVVDGMSGEVIATREENALTELLEYRPPPVGGDAPIPLAQAVELAQTAVQARAVEAEVERSWRGDRYEVELLGPKGKIEVELSALTGAIIEVED